MSSHQPPKLAIFAVADYPRHALWDQVKVFVETAPRLGPDHIVVLITRRLSRAWKLLFDRAGVHCLELIPRARRPAWRDSLKRLVWLPGFNRILLGARASLVFDACVYRHFLYRAALKRFKAEYILFTDVRDVIFQTEIPECAFSNSLFLSQEDVQKCIADEPWTWNWVRAGYGSKAVHALQHHPILCAGLVFGPRDLMIAYNKAILSSIRKLPPRVQVLEGVDQGVHNWLAYSDRIGRWQVSTAESGWMRTIGLLSAESLTWAGSGKLTNPDGSVVPIVHQYDRHWNDPRIQTMLSASGAVPSW